MQQLNPSNVAANQAQSTKPWGRKQKQAQWAHLWSALVLTVSFWRAGEGVIGRWQETHLLGNGGLRYQWLGKGCDRHKHRAQSEPQSTWDQGWQRAAGTAVARDLHMKQTHKFVENVLETDLLPPSHIPFYARCFCSIRHSTCIAKKDQRLHWSRKNLISYLPNSCTAFTGKTFANTSKFCF